MTEIDEALQEVDDAARCGDIGHDCPELVLAAEVRRLQEELANGKADFVLAEDERIEWVKRAEVAEDMLDFYKAEWEHSKEMLEAAEAEIGRKNAEIRQVKEDVCSDHCDLTDDGDLSEHEQDHCEWCDRLSNALRAGKE